MLLAFRVDKSCEFKQEEKTQHDHKHTKHALIAFSKLSVGEVTECVLTNNVQNLESAEILFQTQ